MPNNNNKTLEHMNTKLKAQHGEELYYPISIKAEKHNAKQREMIDSSSTSDCHYCNKDTNCDKVKTMFHACSAEAEKIHKIIERFELHERSSYFPKVYEDHLNEHNKKNSEFLSKFENKLEVMDRKVNNFYRMSRLVNSYIISLMYRILIGKEREPTNFKPNEEPIRADRAKLKTLNTIESVKAYYNERLDNKLKRMYIRYKKLAKYYESKRKVFFRDQILKILIDTEIFCHVPKDESMLLEFSAKHSLVAKFRFAINAEIEDDQNIIRVWMKDLKLRFRCLHFDFDSLEQEYKQIWASIKHYRNLEIKDKNRCSSKLVLHERIEREESKYCFSLNDEVYDDESIDECEWDHEDVNIWIKKIIKKHAE